MSASAVIEYIEGVLSGRILVCQFVRQAVQRHVDDLETGADRGLVFDENAANRVFQFFSLLKHSKGKWAGKPFTLEGWEAFIVWVIFGWKRANGLRRFTEAYCEIPRKNGKSTLAAGIGLYCFMADGEQGAEVYSAATKRDQAKIIHTEAKNMLKSSPLLKRYCGIFTNNISVEKTNSKFEPLSSDHDTMDGLNVSCGIIDELHAHKTSGVYDLIKTGTGAREQPLILQITTAGTERESICFHQREYGVGVLERAITDDSFFTYISTIDVGDDWRDELVWQKANPNFGVSVFPDTLRDHARKAIESPTELNSFLRLKLNVWTEQETRWLSVDTWNEQAWGNYWKKDYYKGILKPFWADCYQRYLSSLKIVELEDVFVGRPCHAGLDLAAVSDFNALVYVFPYVDDPERVDVLARFWCPEARLTDRQNRFREQYQAWHREGYLTVTPGDAVDYGFIKKQVMEDCKRFEVIDLRVDKLFQGYQMTMELDDELQGVTEVAAMGMGFLSFAAPMKDFEGRYLKRKIHHYGNPVLKWMISNVSVKQDPVGNLKPDKSSSQGKIDGFVALVMALDGAGRYQSQESCYEAMA